MNAAPGCGLRGPFAFQAILRKYAAGMIAIVLASLTIVVISTNAQASTGMCPPSPTTAETQLSSPSSANLLDPPPEVIVACVGSQSVSGATFSHWAVVAQKGDGSSKHRMSTATVIDEVMGFLVSSSWVVGEASALNIQVSEAEVRHTFDSIRGQQFPKRREFTEFLKSSGETIADLLFRVRLNLLSNRIQRHVLADHKGRRGERALKRFVRDFRRKWTAETYCAQAYAVSDCGHVKATL